MSAQHEADDKTPEKRPGIMSSLLAQITPTAVAVPQMSVSKLDRAFLMVLGVVASLSLVVCALNFLVTPAAIDGLGGLLPDGSTPDPSREWLGAMYAMGLVSYALAAVPIVAVCAVRFYRLNPILILTATAWLELSFVLELINNLPLVAQFLMPPSATPVGMSEEALTYLSQLNSLSYLALDFLGFMLAYVGLAIISVVIYRRSRSLAIITAVSFALFLANVPFLWLEPKILASILMGLAILIFAGFPFIMAKVSLQPNDE